MSDTLQQRHFEAIAEIISRLDGDLTRRMIAFHFANYLPRWNAKFKRDVFLRACKVKDD